MIKKSAAHEIPNFRVSPLGAVVTHKVRIINDYSFSFEAQNRKTKGGLNADSDSDSVPQCLCAEALPKFLAELVNLRKKYLIKRILMSKADVSDAFRNVRIDPDEAHTLLLHGRGIGSHRFPPDVRLVRVPGFLGCDVGIR